MMDLSQFAPEQEQPLERLLPDGGFCSIFRRIGCVGDSLSSGEFEGVHADGSKEYYDIYEQSWGQYLGRMCGSKVLNFSKGGMTASEYCKTFAEEKGFWDRDLACQAYIVALGVNDLLNYGQPVGSIADIDPEDWHNNKPTFAGWYGMIIQRLKQIEPRAQFFLMTIPRDEREGQIPVLAEQHRELLRQMTGFFDNCWLLDFRQYAPVYDAAFKEKFFLGGHMNPCGYVLTAKMTASYIDWIIRRNMPAFFETGFVGTPYRYHLD